MPSSRRWDGYSYSYEQFALRASRMFARHACCVLRAVVRLLSTAFSFLDGTDQQALVIDVHLSKQACH